MNNEYYGVASTPMDDFLAHYGVQGMKWGVTKAKNKGLTGGTNRALDRQYKKAMKKLNKLNDNADISTQTAKSKKLSKISKISGAIGAAGVGGVGAAYGLTKKNAKNYYNALGKIPGVSVHETTDGRHIVESYADSWGKMDDVTRKYSNRQNKLTAAGLASKAVGLAGIGTAIGTGIAAKKAKNRTTASGHATAVARRNAWQSEMKKQFAGTAYANKISTSTKKRRKK